MNRKENIKKMYEQAKLDTLAGRDKAVLEKMKEIYLQESKAEPKTAELSVWRIIMKSNITKIAAAAVIIIGICFALYFFEGTIELTSIVFADALESMKTMPFVHIEIVFFSSGVTGPKEIWVSFESKIFATRMVDGQRIFINLNEHRLYTYDPNNQRITIDYVDENEFPDNFSTPISIVENMIMQHEKQDAETAPGQVNYNGELVLLQESDWSANSNNRSTSKYIQPNSRLLLCEQFKTSDSEGTKILLGEITFNYPQTGPADIYELGVSRDAEIVNNLPD